MSLADAPSGSELAVRPIWLPAREYIERSPLHAFLERHGCATVGDLDARSRADRDWFWGAAAEALELEWLEPPARVSSGEDPSKVEWFPGGRFNLADNAVDRWVRRGRGDERALSWELESGRSGSLTFYELAAEVDRVARGLRELGVRRSDRVAIQLPMVVAAAVAPLACAKIGAIAVPLFSGFGASAVVERTGRVGARLLIVADSYLRRGRQIEAADAAARAAEGLPAVEWTVVVGAEESERILRRREIGWETLGAEVVEPLEPEPLPAQHPFQIAFTSGTTGRPKGAVLTQAGFAVKAGTDAAWLFGLAAGDRAAWITDPGWIMAPITLVGGLLAGSAVALFDGAVDWPDPGRLWRFVEARAVTMLGVSPTLTRLLKAAGEAAQPPELPSLRVLASSGEPWTPDAFRWLFELVGHSRLPVINYSGGTEVSGAILSNTTIQPVIAGGFAGPVPGMGADVVDDRGEPVRGAPGELVLRVASPGMAAGFWDDRESFVRTYWSRLPGVWTHADLAVVDGDAWYILGRSDDTLKIAGKRLGPAEVESIVNSHALIAESAAVAVPDAITGEALVVFARTSADGAEADALRAEIVESVAAQLGRPFRPRDVVLVGALPKTRSGKIMRRLARSAYLGDPLGDVSALDDPGVLAELRRDG